MSIQVQRRWSHSSTTVSCVQVATLINICLSTCHACSSSAGYRGTTPRWMKQNMGWLKPRLSLQYNRKHAKMKYHPFHNFWTFHHRKKSVFPSDFFTSIFRIDFQVSIFRFYVWIYQLVADRLHFKWTTAYQNLRTAPLQKPHLRSTWRWIQSRY